MNIIIASSRQWNNWMVDDLRGSFDKSFKFSLVTRSEELTLSCLEEKKPDYIFFPHWSSFISKEIFERFNCVIFHMTDLPYGRGGSPLQNLIVNGHRDTKISAIKCVKKLDGGPVYLKKDLSLQGTATEIFERASKVIRNMIAEIIQENPTPVEQEGEVVNFKRRRPEESDSREITDNERMYDHIRMLDADGYPLAFLESDYLKFEFSQAELNEGELYARVKISKK